MDHPSIASTNGRYKNLVLVCCHSIYKGTDDDIGNEDNWVLAPYQASDPETGRPAEHRTFILHIFAGLSATENKLTDQLMFSGGYTVLPELSEAQSYGKVLRLARPDRSVQYATEEVATDSYQNLLFSIVRFRQLNGAYPENISVITHGFKESRFLDLHAMAIKWPAHRIRVQGINPPFTRKEFDATAKGELENAYQLFEQNPYGVNPPLREKREKRRWGKGSIEKVMFPGIEPEVVRLLNWDGGKSGTEIFSERLPWED
jgi:hypothetical protein